MPELPEVETMRRGIEPVVGSRIIGIFRPRSRFKPITFSPSFDSIRRAVKGSRIDQVGRVGKRLVLWLDCARVLVIEPRMTGRLMVSDPPDWQHVRLVLELSGRHVRRLLFWDSRGLGMVHLLRPERFAELFGPHRIGPDALSITLPVLRQRLQSSRRPIKLALMDQQVVAGIGNIYASEILHRAKVDPRSRCDKLRLPQWRRILTAMRHVLREAIEHQGSTLSDGTYGTSDGRPGGFQNYHLVYQRAGLACLSCKKGKIRRIVLGQRSTFYCPACQKLFR